MSLGFFVAAEVAAQTSECLTSETALVRDCRTGRFDRTVRPNDAHRQMAGPPKSLGCFFSQTGSQFVKASICDERNMGGCMGGLSASNVPSGPQLLREGRLVSKDMRL
jgi:hypothetical protein